MTTLGTVASARSSVLGVGVSTHTAPLNMSASAPSSPSSSLPAIGWPPTKRGSSHASHTGALTEPTSVTTPRGLGQRPLDLVGDRQHRHGDDRDLGIGDRARRHRSGRSASALASWLPGLASSPCTRQPRWRSPAATEPADQAEPDHVGDVLAVTARTSDRTRRSA